MYVESVYLRIKFSRTGDSENKKTRRYEECQICFAINASRQLEIRDVWRWVYAESSRIRLGFRMSWWLPWSGWRRRCRKREYEPERRTGYWSMAYLPRWPMWILIIRQSREWSIGQWRSVRSWRWKRSRWWISLWERRIWYPFVLRYCSVWRVWRRMPIMRTGWDREMRRSTNGFTKAYVKSTGKIPSMSGWSWFWNLAGSIWSVWNYWIRLIQRTSEHRCLRRFIQTLRKGRLSWYPVMTWKIWRSCWNRPRGKGSTSIPMERCCRLMVTRSFPNTSIWREILELHGRISRRNLWIFRRRYYLPPTVWCLQDQVMRIGSTLHQW